MRGAGRLLGGEDFLDCRANEADERLGVGFGQEGDADDAAAGNETYEHR